MRLYCKAVKEASFISHLSQDQSFNSYFKKGGSESMQSLHYLEMFYFVGILNIAATLSQGLCNSFFISS